MPKSALREKRSGGLILLPRAVLNLDYDFPIRNSFVPQTLHVPWVAGFPFFIVICCGLWMSRFVRHFMQYASITASK